MAVESDDLPAGARLGPYVIVRKLGTGGMGAVHEATHERLNTRVALKTLHAEVALSAESVQRFMREAVASQRLHHPHVVEVVDVGADGGVPYLAMEYLEGETLGTRIKRQPRMPVAEIADLLLPIASALVMAHDHGVVHRDIKPENIFLARTPSGEVPKLLDFGISKITDAETITVTHDVIGTARYMSPEQARDTKHVDARSDQYSFGATLYEALTGVPPVRGETLQQVMFNVWHGDVPSVESWRADVPALVDVFVMRMLARNPDARFPGMREVGSVLVKFASAAARVVWGDEFGAQHRGP